MDVKRFLGGILFRRAPSSRCTPSSTHAIAVSSFQKERKNAAKDIDGTTYSHPPSCAHTSGMTYPCHSPPRPPSLTRTTTRSSRFAGPVPFLPFRALSFFFSPFLPLECTTTTRLSPPFPPATPSSSLPLWHPIFHHTAPLLGRWNSRDFLKGRGKCAGAVHTRHTHGSKGRYPRHSKKFTLRDGRRHPGGHRLQGGLGIKLGGGGLFGMRMPHQHFLSHATPEAYEVAVFGHPNITNPYRGQCLSHHPSLPGVMQNAPLSIDVVVLLPRVGRRGGEGEVATAQDLLPEAWKDFVRWLLWTPFTDDPSPPSSSTSSSAFGFSSSPFLLSPPESAPQTVEACGKGDGGGVATVEGPIEAPPEAVPPLQSTTTTTRKKKKFVARRTLKRRIRKKRVRQTRVHSESGATSAPASRGWRTDEAEWTPKKKDASEEEIEKEKDVPLPRETEKKTIGGDPPSWCGTAETKEETAAAADDDNDAKRTGGATVPFAWRHHKGVEQIWTGVRTIHWSTLTHSIAVPLSPPPPLPFSIDEQERRRAASDAFLAPHWEALARLYHAHCQGIVLGHAPHPNLLQDGEAMVTPIPPLRHGNTPMDETDIPRHFSHPSTSPHHSTQKGEAEHNDARRTSPVTRAPPHRHPFFSSSLPVSSSSSVAAMEGRRAAPSLAILSRVVVPSSPPSARSSSSFFSSSSLCASSESSPLPHCSRSLFRRCRNGRAVQCTNAAVGGPPRPTSSTTETATFSLHARSSSHDGSGGSPAGVSHGGSLSLLQQLHHQHRRHASFLCVCQRIHPSVWQPSPTSPRQATTALFSTSLQVPRAHPLRRLDAREREAGERWGPWRRVLPSSSTAAHTLQRLLRWRYANDDPRAHAGDLLLPNARRTVPMVWWVDASMVWKTTPPLPVPRMPHTAKGDDKRGPTHLSTPMEEEEEKPLHRRPAEAESTRGGPEHHKKDDQEEKVPWDASTTISDGCPSTVSSSSLGFAASTSERSTRLPVLLPSLFPEYACEALEKMGFHAVDTMIASPPCRTGSQEEREAKDALKAEVEEEERRREKWIQSFGFLLASLQEEWGVNASLSRIPQNQVLTPVEDSV